jgi:hypothetical protein
MKVFWQMEKSVWPHSQEISWEGWEARNRSSIWGYSPRQLTAIEGKIADPRKYL